MGPEWEVNGTILEGRAKEHRRNYEERAKKKATLFMKEVDSFWLYSQIRLTLCVKYHDSIIGNIKEIKEILKFKCATSQKSWKHKPKITLNILTWYSHNLSKGFIRFMSTYLLDILFAQTPVKNQESQPEKTKTNNFLVRILPEQIENGANAFSYQPFKLLLQLN